MRLAARQAGAEGPLRDGGVTSPRPLRREAAHRGPGPGPGRGRGGHRGPGRREHARPSRPQVAGDLGRRRADVAREEEGAGGAGAQLAHRRAPCTRGVTPLAWPHCPHPHQDQPAGRPDAGGGGAPLGATFRQ